jgi:hypothetical protein
VRSPQGSYTRGRYGLQTVAGVLDTLLYVAEVRFGVSTGPQVLSARGVQLSIKTTGGRYRSMISQRVTSVFGRNRSCGLMDKAPASGAGDSRFESVLDHSFLFDYFSFCAVCQQRQGFHIVQFIVLRLRGESARFAAPRRRSVRY